MISPGKTLLLSMLLLVSSYTAIELVTKSNPILAQPIFPDLAADYWANPFIQKLAEINVVVGYPDGKFRPQQPIKRDEFAAMIHQAFEQKQTREISSVGQFKDVPENHWAKMAIAEAYETGFMQTTGENENSFSPNLPVSKTDAIVALTNGLKMLESEGQDVVTTPSVNKQSRVTKYRLAFPLASTTIMPSGMPLASTAIVTPLARVNKLPSKSFELSALATMRTFYEDTNLISEEAIDNIAVATKRGLIVNYPRPKYLEPNQLLNRGAATALVHQALVSTDKLPPLAKSTDAFQYIVVPRKD